MKALQSGGRCFTADAVQIELPNKLNPHGFMAAVCAGKKVMEKQVFQIVSELAQGERVATEARWTGVLATSFGSVMKAHFRHVLYPA